MADDADMAADRMEVEEELRRRVRPAPELPAIGQCYYCAASVAPGHRFCDADCRDEWQYEQRLTNRRA